MTRNTPCRFSVRTSSRSKRCRLLLPLLTATLCLMTAVPTCADSGGPLGPTQHLYIYGALGVVMDETATYNALGYVYDVNGNPEQVTVDAVSGTVYDWNCDIVGYLTTN